MRKFIFLTVLTTVISISSFAFAATVTVSAIDLPSPSDIESFSFTLSVDVDFVFTDSSGIADGTLIPAAGGGVLPWAYDNNATVSGGSYTATFFNADVFDFGLPPGDGAYTLNNLLGGTGTVGSFDFTGTILGISSFTFADELGIPVSYSDLIVADWDPSTNTASFTVGAPVPIPGSILLLGSGLVGLVGLVRRRRS